MVNLRFIFHIWWPLAASWMLMAIEGPAVSILIARLANPEINLAAFGGILDPIRFLIFAPVTMLLATSTALSKDWPSYLKLRRFMYITGSILTFVHFLIAYTPLYFILMQDIMGIPDEVLQAARPGLMIMLPLVLAIGFRRFQQGVLIRFGYSGAVMAITMARLVTLVTFLLVGFFIPSIDGVIISSIALTMSMIVEALYAGWRVRPVIQEVKAEPIADPLNWRGLFVFFIPLMFTAFLSTIGRPIVSSAMSRMPETLQSLAILPVVIGLIFLLQTFGVAYNEVVVSLLDRPGSYWQLRKFTIILSIIMGAAALIIAATPLSTIWFQDITSLPLEFVKVAKNSFWLLLPAPVIIVWVSWFQGALITSKNTRAVTEGVIVYLIFIVSFLVFGVFHSKMPGIYYGMLALSISLTAQASWAWFRSREALKSFRLRDSL
ncbi:MAG: hypothetical protein JEZ06_13570 [Anaerolineaceae bacterium]|nr:hypothetical protein [Anaerolineaceae bacterium]